MHASNGGDGGLVGLQLALKHLENDVRYPLGTVEPLDVLADEFAHSEIHAVNVAQLGVCGYSLRRRVRGDGNCFYRAVCFAWLEALVARAERGLSVDMPLPGGWPEASQFGVLIEEYRYLRSAVDRLKQQGGGSGHDLLARLLTDARLDLCAVALLRLVTAAFLAEFAAAPCANSSANLLRSAVSEKFVEHGSMEGYARAEVLPMGREAEGVSIYAAAVQLGVRMRIMQFDNREGPLAHYVYPTEDYEGPLGIEVHLLFKPGHYELLYLRESKLPASPELFVGRCSFCHECATMKFADMLVCFHRLCPACSAQVSKCPNCVDVTPFSPTSNGSVHHLPFSDADVGRMQGSVLGAPAVPHNSGPPDVADSRKHISAGYAAAAGVGPSIPKTMSPRTAAVAAAAAAAHVRVADSPPPVSAHSSSPQPPASSHSFSPQPLSPPLSPPEDGWFPMDPPNMASTGVLPQSSRAIPPWQPPVVAASTDWLAGTQGDLRGVQGPPRSSFESCWRATEISKAHDDMVTGIVGGGNRVYTCSRDGTLRRWQLDCASGDQITLREDNFSLSLGSACCSLVVHGQWLFCGLDDGRICGFSETGEEVTLRGLSGHQGCVSSLQAHEVHGLFSGGADGSVRCWQKQGSLPAFSCQHCSEKVLPDGIQFMAILGSTLWLGGASRLALVELGPGNSLRRCCDLIPCNALAALLADEVRANVVAAHTDGTVSVFNASGTLEWQGSSTGEPNTSSVRCASWLMDGQWPPRRQSSRAPHIYCGYADGQVGTRVGQPLLSGASWRALDGSGVSSVCCSIRDGTDAIIVGADDGRLLLWLRCGALMVKTEQAL